MVQLNTLVAHTLKSQEAIKEVGKDLAELYDMTIHRSGAYDLSSRLKGNSRSELDPDSETAKIAKLVEGLPDV
tara:strand:- start:1555 stop:1773 length:219 start_codon:yes stop_codon:yes gene_type:complete